MNLDIFSRAVRLLDAPRPKDEALSRPGQVRIRNPGRSYTERHRGQWFRPEYDFEQVQIAQDTDSYFSRAVEKKTNRFFIAGYDLVSENPDTLAYIQRRILEIELATQKPFALLLTETANDLNRYYNCMWAKVRSREASSGRVRKIPTVSGERELDPVAGYFVLPFETLEFKTKPNGDITKILQQTRDGKPKEFAPEDTIHFYMNRKPGFSVGTPGVVPVLDDLMLLRRIEENVEELVESNVFPLFHYQVGTDEMPERNGPDGKKETDILRETVEYMPSGGVLITDHRHKVTAIGSEGRALRIDYYLEYFKKRVFAGLGISPVDMGEGDSSNRSTASTMSKSLMQDVEALQGFIKLFVESFVFQELLLEGPFGAEALLPENRVEIRFGIIDKEDRAKLENQVVQLWLNKLLNETEARKRLGFKPMDDEGREGNYFKLYEEVLALIAASGPGSAGTQALGEAPTAAITPEQVKQEQKNLEKVAAKKTGRPPSAASSGAKRASATTARPSNQHGTRSAPKLSNDQETQSLIAPLILEILDLIHDPQLEPACLIELASVVAILDNRVVSMSPLGVSKRTVVDNFRWRFQQLAARYAPQGE